MKNLDRTISLKIDKETLNKIKKLADNDGRSVSNYIRLLLNKVVKGK
ncbi:MAG: hypothetical protein IIA45_14440 [Bacteroidetes bacterium]|nr:hypothetical protein [Bacteroidota bacterium]